VSAIHVQLLAVCAAFWLALWLHGRIVPGRTGRFALALLLGAALTRAGHALVFEADARALLELGAGVSILFLPLGVLLLAPTPAGLASLPLPLAVARLGCVAAGCCRGRNGEPLALAEAAALLILHFALGRTPPRLALPAFAMTFGGLRLLEQPWRAESMRSFALLSPTAVAVGWLAVGLALWALEIHRGRTREAPLLGQGRSVNNG